MPAANSIQYVLQVPYMIDKPLALVYPMPQAPELIDDKIPRPRRKAGRTAATAQPERSAHRPEPAYGQHQPNPLPAHDLLRTSSKCIRRNNQAGSVQPKCAKAENFQG